MEFSVKVKEGFSFLYYRVKLLQSDGRFETFHVHRDKEEATLISNRPMLRAKGLKYKRVGWKIKGSNIIYTRTLQQITDGIESKMDSATPQK